MTACPRCEQPGEWTFDDEFTHEDLDAALNCELEGISFGQLVEAELEGGAS